jgi:hypothetical protein
MGLATSILYIALQRDRRAVTIRNRVRDLAKNLNLAAV